MAAAGHTPRVNQLDALRVDEELLLLLQQEVSAALHHTFPAAAAKYRRELQLLLQLFFFCGYTLRNIPTPGAVLQNVRYGESKTSTSNGGSRRFNAIRDKSISSPSLGSSSNSTGHRNCSSAGTARDSSIGGADHLAEGREPHLHRQQGQQSARNRVSQQALRAEVQGRDRIWRSSSNSSSPTMQQNLSLKQRLLLLLLSTVLPYSFEHVQQYIHRRYVALLAVLQQRMLRAQTVRRMQQQELRRQQQQRHLQSSVQDPQNTSQRHQQSRQQLPHQQLREQHPSPSQQPYQRQQREVCCNDPESTMRSSICSRCHHYRFSDSINFKDISRDNRKEDPVDSSLQRRNSCFARRGTDAVQWGCDSSQTFCSCSAALVSGPAALAVSLSAAASSSASSEAQQPLAASTILLSREERRILLLYKASQIAELIVSMAQLLQMFCFLATGRYRCLSDWLLLLQMRHIDPSLHRSITLDLLQQQLAWQAVLQLLLMVLPQLPHQESLLRTLLARVRRINMDVTARAARLRTSCIVFLQRQARRHTAMQRQEQERPRSVLHQRREHRRQDGSARVQEFFRTNRQQKQPGSKQLEERQALEEEVQQRQQQHQRHRAQYSLGELTSPHEQRIQRDIRIRSRAVGITKKTLLLIKHERQKSVLHWGSSGEEPPQQMHACTQSIFQSVGNWLRHGAVRMQSKVIKHTCLKLLRILQSSTSHAHPVGVTSATRAAATAAAPAAPGTPAAVIRAADAPTAAAAGGVPAALAQGAAAAAAPVARGRTPCGNCHALRPQSSSSEGQSTIRATPAHQNGGRASTVVTQLQRQGNTTRSLQGQQQTEPSASPAQGCGTRKRYGRSAGTGGRKELGDVQKTVVPDEALRKEEALDKPLASWRQTEFRQQCVAALQHEQDQQEQQQEPDEEEDLACVFCGRNYICLAFRGSNCSHRFCYYCVAAHPIYHEQMKRQQATTAAAAAARRAARHFGSKQSARPSLAAERLRLPAAGPGGTSPGATAEAPGADEQGQLLRTATAGHREGETRGGSVGRREETKRNGSSTININATSSSEAGGSGDSRYNREKREPSWLAFFGLTLDEEAEEDTLKCPACGVLVEEIQWAA